MRIERIRHRHQGLSWGLRWGATLLLAAGSAASGRVEVNVTRVGFPSVRSGQVVRSGTWTPMVVDIALVEQAGFDGTVRVAQFDTDGDEAYDSVDVHLRAETGGTQRVMLYAPANVARHSGRFFVEVLGQEGEAVQVVSQGVLTYRAAPSEWAQDIRDDTLLLAVSSGVLGRVRDLVDPGVQATFRRSVRVAHISPSELPDLWIGLEAVDYVVWDDARPEELSQRQREALVTWVRQGGTLLIAASRTASTLKLTPELDAILPASIGEVIAVDNLPMVRLGLVGEPAEADDRQRRVGDEWYLEPYLRPLTVVSATRREGAESLPEDTGTSIGSDVVTRWLVDRGVVVFSAVTLKELFSAPGEPAGFFKNVFALQAVDDADGGMATPRSLFPHIVSAISFSTSASLYLLAALAFSVVYLAAATGGVWWFLGRRNLRQHSWSAFALVAGAASVLSVMVVNAMRGFGETVHQLSVIDLEAGESFGTATAYFGVKTGTDKEMDVWLPSDPLHAREPTATQCFVRALPAGGDPGEASATRGFADPESYRLVPASAVLDDVRFRATLKRFEGRWEGPVRGTVTGQVGVSRGRITEDSFIINELGVDLRNCWLLHATVDPGDVEGNRSNQVYALALGDLPAQRSKVMLAERCYRPQGTQTLSNFLVGSTLDKRQRSWSSPFLSRLANLGFGASTAEAVRMGEEEKAILLASTVSDFDPATITGMLPQFGQTTWTRELVRCLDLRSQLRKDSLVLIGFSDEPGPIRLFRRVGDREYRSLEPDPRRSWSVFRVRLPATVLDDRPPPEEEEF